MTRKDLQDALVKETKELLKDVWAKNSLGEDVQAHDKKRFAGRPG
nr:MAG TPA: hypothetical protein [Caudoviricetes sp.]